MPRKTTRKSAPAGDPNTEGNGGGTLNAVETVLEEVAPKIADAILPGAGEIVALAEGLIHAFIPGKEATLEECNAAVLRFAFAHNYGTEADQEAADAIAKAKAEADATVKQAEADAAARLHAEEQRHARLLLGVAEVAAAALPQLSDESDEAFAQRMGLKLDPAATGDIGMLG